MGAGEVRGGCPCEGVPVPVGRCGGERCVACVMLAWEGFAWKLACAAMQPCNCHATAVQLPCGLHAAMQVAGARLGSHHSSGSRSIQTHTLRRPLGAVPPASLAGIVCKLTVCMYW